MSIETINKFAADVAKKGKELTMASSDDKYTKLAKMLNLADIKTLDSLISKVQAGAAQTVKAKNALIKEKGKVDKLGVSYDKMEAKLKEISDEQMKVGNEWGDAKDKWDDMRNKMYNVTDEAFNNYERLEREANAVEAAAKQLGIDKIPAVNNARKAMGTFEKYYKESNKAGLDVPKG